MNEYLLAISIGAGLALCVVLGYLISLLVQWIWSIIDEEPIGEANWFVCFVCKLWGYSRNPKGSQYTHTNMQGNKTDGDGPCFMTALVLLCTPITIWTSIQFYPIALTIGTTIAIVALARFARRTFKRLAKHEADVNAHKNTEA